MINCTLCDGPLGKESFSVQVFYNDGSEETLKNTIVPDDMRAVVIYSHDGCKTIKESKRTRFKFDTSKVKVEPKREHLIPHYVEKYFKIVKKSNRYLMVVPK